MKVRELLKFLQGADPDWEVIVAPMTELPHYNMSELHEKKQTGVFRMPSPILRYRIVDVMHTGDVNTAENAQYLSLGYDSELPIEYKFHRDDDAEPEESDLVN